MQYEWNSQEQRYIWKKSFKKWFQKFLFFFRFFFFVCLLKKLLLSIPVYNITQSRFFLFQSDVPDMKRWNSFKDHDGLYVQFFIMSHTLKRNLTKLVFCFKRKKTSNLKSSYHFYFMEKNHEIWRNVNSNMVFL